MAAMRNRAILFLLALVLLSTAAMRQSADLDRAAELLAGQRFDEALALYRAYLAEQPEGSRAAEAAFAAADCLLALGRYSESVDAFNSALQRFKDSPRAAKGYIGLGKAELRLGHLGEATRHFSEAMSTSSSPEIKGEVDALLAEAYYEANRFADAVEPLERLLANGAAAAQRRDNSLRLADCYYRLGEAERAREMLAELLEADPELLSGAPELAFRWGEILYLTGDYDPAGIVLQEVLTDYPSNPVFRHALLRMGDVERVQAEAESDSRRKQSGLVRAIGNYRRLLLETELDRRAADTTGHFLSDVAALRIVQSANAGAFDTAADFGLPPATEMIAGVIERRLSNEITALGRLLLARAHLAAGDRKEALENYRILLTEFGYLDVARAARSEHELVARELLGSAFEQGDYSGYIDIYQNDGADLSLTQEDRMRLAESYYRVQIYDRALDQFSRLSREAESEEMRRRAVIGLARTQAAMGERRDALDSLERFLATNPPPAEREDALLLMLDIHYRLGDAEGLRNWLAERRNELNTPRLRATAVFRLGILAKRAGDSEQATEMLERFLLEFGGGIPGSANIQSYLRDTYLALGDLYYDRGQLRVAAGYYELYIAIFGDSEDISFPLFQSANCRMRLGEKALAVSILKELVRLYPESGWSSQAKLTLAEVEPEAGEDAR